MRTPRWWLVVVILLVVVPCVVAADADQSLRRIAFGSCAHQDKPMPIWRAIVDSQPDLFLFIGDTIYADTQDMAVMKAKYQKLADQPGWLLLKKTCPILGCWDDHDYGGNDVGAEYPKKIESQQLFLDFFGEPQDSPRRKQEGVYQAKLFGPPKKRVQIILLDTRYHRSPLKKRDKFIPDEGPYVPNDDPKATFLGDVQWKWLEEQLKVPAQLRILASSIQLIAEDHGFEKWMNINFSRHKS
jgi:alkaline phosphatase D